MRPEIRSVFFVIAPWQAALMSAAALAPDPRLKTYVVDMERHSLARNIWHYRDLPELAKQLDVDLVHLTYPMPVNSGAYPCPTVVTLHDIYPYEIPMNFGFPKFLFNRMVLQHCLRKVNAIASVSDATKTGLLRYFPNTSRKCVRIYNCVEPEDLSGEEETLPGWQGTSFLLSIAQHRRNKNIPLLVRAYDRLLRSGQMSSETELVVVGIQGPETAGLRRLLAERGLERRVHLLEGLPEAQLRWCYRQCVALVAPSITEGFGLSIAEGLMTGCRIVASDIAAHREIGGGRCKLIQLDSEAEETLASAIGTTLRMPKPRPIALPQLTSQVLGEQYFQLYQRVIAASRKGSKMAAASEMLVATSGRRSR